MSGATGNAITVTPAGATTTSTLATLFQRSVYVEDFGAVGNAVLASDGASVASGTDDGPAFQAAIASLGSAGGVVLMQSKQYLIRTALTLNTCRVTLQGEGCYEGGAPHGGSWIIQDTAASGFHLFNLGGAYTSSSTYSPPTNAIGSAFRDFGIYQCHPLPSATAGTAWTPAAYDWVFNIQNLYGGFTIDGVFFCAVNKGINVFGCGHFFLERITGQFFTRGIMIGNCQDEPYIGTLRHWTYKTSNVNVLTYQQANLDVLTLGRCDGGGIDRVFAFCARSVVHCVQEAPITGQPNPSGNTPGGCASGNISQLSGDHCMYGVWFDTLNPGGNAVIWQLGEANFNCVSISQSGTAVSGGCGIYVNVQNWLILQVSSLSLFYMNGSGVQIAGDTNSIQISNLIANVCNFAKPTQPAPVINVGDNSGNRFYNMCMVGTARVLNCSGAALFGSSGNGVFGSTPTIFDGYAPVAQGSPSWVATPALAASTTRLLTVASGNNRLSVVPNAPAGSYNPLVQSGDSVILADVSAVNNTGSLCVVPHAGATVGFRASANGTATVAGSLVALAGPVRFGAYAVGSLPNAGSFAGDYISVTGASVTSYGPLAYSNGSAWLWVGTTVKVS